MSQAEHQDELHEVSEAVSNPLETARQRRAAALRAAEGMWKNRDDIPGDGVHVQEQLRAEWH